MDYRAIRLLLLLSSAAISIFVLTYIYQAIGNL